MSASGNGPDIFRQSLAHDVDAPEAARNSLARLAREMGRETLQTAQLLVSELVTNAVRHGRGLAANGSIALEGFLDEDRLYVEIRDGGTGFEPRPGEPGELRSSGWGLVLVDQLADRWGVSSETDVRVWFELGLATEAAPGGVAG